MSFLSEVMSSGASPIAAVGGIAEADSAAIIHGATALLGPSGPGSGGLLDSLVDNVGGDVSSVLGLLGLGQSAVGSPDQPLQIPSFRSLQGASSGTQSGGTSDSNSSAQFLVD